MYYPPLVNNTGDEEHPSTEATWDALSAGKIIYGIGVRISASCL